MGDSAETGQFVDRFVDFCHPHRVITRSESEELLQLCEVIKDHLWRKAKAMVKEAGDHAILYSYGSDGTPMLTRQTTTTRLASGRVVKRSAGSGTEFLVQMAFLKYYQDSGEARMACLVDDPTPMANGKSAWHHFAAASAFFPTIRSLGHSGVVVSHYVFDRAVFASTARKMQ